MEALLKMVREHDFSKRWAKLADYMSQHIQQTNAILIQDGSDDEDSIKIKTLALQSFLFRFEFYNSVIMIGQKKLIFFSNSQKAKLFESFKVGSGFEVKIIGYQGKVPSSEEIKKLMDSAEKFGFKKLGYFKKEKQGGDMIKMFSSELKKKEFELVDVTSSVQKFLSVKEEKDIKLMQKSGKMTGYFFKKLVEEVEEVIDSGEKVSHQVISEKVDSMLENDKGKIRRFGLDPSYYDFAYAPLVQSNDKYDLRPTAENDKRHLSSDCIILNMCGKYFEINVLMIRSLLVNPTEKDKKNYKALYYLHEKVKRCLVPGKSLKEVYQAAKKGFLGRYPDLEEHLPSNFGFGIGFEFKEKCLLIGSKNEGIVQSNQVYAVITSLKKLNGFKGKEYSLQLADTLKIEEEGTESLTSTVSAKLDDIGYNFDEPEDEENGTNHQTNGIENGKENVLEHDNYTNQKLQELKKREAEFSGKRMTRAALKKEKILAQGLKQQRRIEHQKELLERKMADIEKRIKEKRFTSKNDATVKIRVEDVETYKPGTFPNGLSPDEIKIDSKRFAVLLPIHGRVVPFHVALLKNVVKQHDGEMSRVRFNFFRPGLAIPNFEYAPLEKYNEGTIFLQEMIYKSAKADKLAKMVKKVKELKKRFQLRELTDALARNENLQLGSKISSLYELKMRPALAGHKSKGALHAYKNGIRFVGKKGEVFELSFANIRHCIFQPCDDNFMIILHFRLKRGMLVNKKKVMDVQFFSEVGAVAEDLHDRGRRNRYDINELDEEEVEAELRSKFNETFNRFVRDVERKAQMEFERPKLEYGFFGSPYYNNVFVTPCETCLVSIVDTPLFVLSLEDIEVVSLERIDNKIKNFDMVLIFKDYSRSVQTISNIPKKDLEQIKDWLDYKKILFFEGGSVNLKWDNILKKILENPEAFLEEGGWRGFFDEEEETQEDEQEEEGSEFHMSDQESDEEDDFNLEELEDGSEVEEEFDDDEDDDIDDAPIERKVTRRRK